MPIYEYSCPDCGNQFSHLHKRLDETAPACPKCQGANVRKRISSFSTRGTTTASSCAVADSCPAAAAGGHQCCTSCRHR
ncbi:MAG: zinc ribbon domain-containing protein [Lentisphaerae bacterium]|nr:zinc ribbon domain-containing protein [Lentisphaerota bacterium]